MRLSPDMKETELPLRETTNVFMHSGVHVDSPELSASNTSPQSTSFRGRVADTDEEVNGTGRL